MVTLKPTDSKYCSPAEVEYIEKAEAHTVSDASSAVRVKRDLGWLDKINRTKKVVPLKTVGEVFRSWNVSEMRLVMDV